MRRNRFGDNQHSVRSGTQAQLIEREQKSGDNSAQISKRKWPRRRRAFYVGVTQLKKKRSGKEPDWLLTKSAIA